MGSTQESKRAVGKKFVIACDGTWMNSDMGYEEDGTSLPSNVTRIVRALKHRDDNGISQIAFYQRGVGTDSDDEDKIWGGFTGDDISEHIREAYAFLANNFDPETQAQLDDPSKPRDDIVLLGFSRGAYTARCISDLVSTIGLLTKIGMESFGYIFEDWKNQDMPGKESKWFESTFRKKIPFTDHTYVQTLVDHGLTRWGMPIRAVGVWDTVGSLGIPLDWGSKNVKPFSFVNCKVPKQVEHAFHALAIDERRGPFSPTLWEQPDAPNVIKVLKQCWFPGVHSNVGGWYPDAGQANISLAWMVSQLEDTEGGILTFDPDYLDYVQDQNIKYYAKVKEPVRPWGFGKLYDSTQITDITSRVETFSIIPRTPGRYHTVNLSTGKQTSNPLVGTNEYIHRCVRVRIEGHGLGIEEEPDTSYATEALNDLEKIIPGRHSAPYTKPPQTYLSDTLKNALKNYELVDPRTERGETGDSAAPPAGVYWRAKDKLKPLLEDTLGGTELRLLRRSLGIAKR